MVTGVTSAIYLFKMFPAIDLRDSNVLCSSMNRSSHNFFPFRGPTRKTHWLECNILVGSPSLQGEAFCLTVGRPWYSVSHFLSSNSQNCWSFVLYMDVLITHTNTVFWFYVMSSFSPSPNFSLGDTVPHLQMLFDIFFWLKKLAPSRLRDHGVILLIFFLTSCYWAFGIQEHFIFNHQ